MERILDIDLTKVEKERADSLRAEHNTSGYLYMITEWSLGCGYHIVWSKHKLKKKDLLSKDRKDIEIITDVDTMLENI